MGNLIICSDFDNKAMFQIKEYKLEEKEDILLLTLKTSVGDIEYSISTDIREPNLKKIQDFLCNQIEKTMYEGKTLYISEYLNRSYIYVGEDGERKQFTAFKRA